MNSTAQVQFRFPSLVVALGFAAFVIYSSLLPLDFQAASRESVTAQFLGLGDAHMRLRSLTDWATNIAIFIALGFFGLASVYRRRGLFSATVSTLLTLAGCFLLSMGIEFAQIFFPPRDSSALDVIANTCGAAVGVGAWFAFGDRFVAAYGALADLHRSTLRTPRLIGKRRLAALAACGLLIAAWAGLFTSGWTGWSVASARLNDVQLLPFIEHQAAGIGWAAISAMLAVVAYAPLGVVLYLTRDNDTLRSRRRRLIGWCALAAGLALFVEGVKLFLVAKRPDTGNIVIASLAVGFGYFFAPLAARIFTSQAAGRGRRAEAEQVAPASHKSTAFFAGRIGAVTCAIAVAALVADYPVGQIALALALLVYAAILTRFPTAWLLVVPALLPVMDFAPWTGRFFFDEFDALVLTTLAVGLWRAAGRPLASSVGLGFWLLALAFSLSFLASALIELLPLQTFDVNSLASHYSHYSALRLVKGLVFAAGLTLLLSSNAAGGEDIKRALWTGMILGLATATGSVIWERLAYADLLNFTQTFRVTGLFSTMHTGGAHLDAFLVTALPFAAVWTLRSQQPLSRLAGAMLFAAGSYAVMVTFSRATIIGLAIGILVVATWAFMAYRRTATSVAGTTIAAISLALAATAIVPAFLGSFMQSRLATTATDFEVRTGHWQGAADMMTDNWTTMLFGMGLGSYPEIHLLLSTDTNKPAVHRFATEADNTFLSIRRGLPLYIDQIVRIEPGREYTLRMKARTRAGNASINVLLCDRTFLQGFDCQSVTFDLSGQAQAGQWQELQAPLNSANLGQNRLRQTKLSLENAGSEMPIDMDDVALLDANGKNLIANGSFESGTDHWFMSSPFNHLPWHIKNLWLEVFFNQGWIGLLLLCALTAAAVARLALLTLRADAFAAVLLAALLAFLAVGAFDSIFDAPRLTLIFGLLIAATAIIRPGTAAAASEALITAAARTGTAIQPATASATAARLASRTNVPSASDWPRMALNLVVTVLIVTAAIVLVTRLPFVPYNVRGLANPFHPFIAPLLLAAFFVWSFGFPAVIARWLSVAGNRGAAYPLVVVAHGLIAWMLLHFAVLPEAIHNVIGSPVLNWPWNMEYAARFVPLVSVLSVQLTGGALLAAALGGGRMGSAPLWWFACTALLSPVQYWIVVSEAATDNLTELMNNNASVQAFLLLAVYMLLIGTAGSLLAGLRTRGGALRISLVLLTVAASLPLGWLLLSNGTESFIVKEAKAFSALQFLLSTDREHYATGRELWSRFAAAHLGAICLIAVAQYPLWKRFRERLPTPTPAV